jgi:predicted dehydrogenase/threonine dehydrogenase-like Zn-dependent dehydrogenase
MKQVVARAGRVEVIDSPIPSIGDNEVLVKTLYSVISSGTETWTIQSTQPLGADDVLGDKGRLKKAFELSSNVIKQEGLSGLVDYTRLVRNPTVPLGYSLSGIVVKVGKNVKDLVIGDRVACAGEGKACHAEYASVPRNLTAKVPEEVDMSEAAFTTLGAIALHGFRTSGSRIGEVIGVIGAGLVGNLTIQIAAAAGCMVVAIDQRKDRLDLAMQSGASLALNPTDPLLFSKVQNITAGRGLDAVIICAATESSEPVNLASKLLRDKGVVTIVGRVGMQFERKDYYQKEIEIRMSRSLGPGRYDQTYEDKSVDYPVGYVRWTLNRNMEGFLQLLKSKKLNLPLLIASRVPVEKATEAYSLLERESKVAVLLYYSEMTQTRQVTSLVMRTKKIEGAINVGLVGPGNFAKEIILPLLRRNKDFNLKWVIASNPLHARQIAERYHFERFGTSYDELLEDKSVDLVIITTPNNLHYEMVVKAARAQKAVFVEKPLCLNKQELQDIVKVQRETGSPIIVGFNRRYSPLVVRLKEEMRRLSPPFMINYRVNADFIPMARWVQDPEIGGGRVIAECCHFIDLFNFLLNSYSPEIYAASVSANGSTVVTRDNVVLILKYPDGSVSTLTYSALGNRNLERERIEVFGDGHAFVLDDFRKLTIFTPKKTSIHNLPKVEKGHKEEFTELAKLLHGERNSLISFEEAVASMNCTFDAETILRSSRD